MWSQVVILFLYHFRAVYWDSGQLPWAGKQGLAFSVNNAYELPNYVIKPTLSVTLSETRNNKRGHLTKVNLIALKKKHISGINNIWLIYNVKYFETKLPSIEEALKLPKGLCFPLASFNEDCSIEWRRYR